MLVGELGRREILTCDNPRLEWTGISHTKTKIFYPEMMFGCIRLWPESSDGEAFHGFVYSVSNITEIRGLTL